MNCRQKTDKRRNVHSPLGQTAREEGTSSTFSYTAILNIQPSSFVGQLREDNAKVIERYGVDADSSITRVPPAYRSPSYSQLATVERNLENVFRAFRDRPSQLRESTHREGINFYEEFNKFSAEILVIRHPVSKELRYTVCIR